MDNKSNESVTEAINRLLQAQADYQEFVGTTSSYQLAIEGVREGDAALVQDDEPENFFPTDEELGRREHFGRYDEEPSEWRLEEASAEYQD